MNELHATISAETLKRVIGVLAAIDDQAMFDIASNGIVCTIQESTNAHQTTITLPKDAYAWENYVAGPAEVGIDLKWMMWTMECTQDAALVDMSIDKTEIHLNIGMHNISQILLDPAEVRKPTENIKLQHTVMMEVSGWFFKAMIKYNAAIEAEALAICANRDKVSFQSWYDLDDSRQYDLEVDCLTKYLDDARGLYSMDFLVDIANHIQPTDQVSLRLGTDRPIEIEYVVDGCEIRHILAPRIEV